MIAPLPTLRTDDQIAGYYAGAAAAVGTDTPFVIQDFPQTFSVQMSVSVIARIANDNANAVMLKHEDWPGLEKISALRRLEEQGQIPRLSILCGNGGAFLDFETERGADGAMTGYCFPDTLVELVALAATGERDQAHDPLRRPPSPAALRTAARSRPRRPEIRTEKTRSSRLRHPTRTRRQAHRHRPPRS